MLLVQDQYVQQNSRKNLESESQLKSRVSKQVVSDPKELWEIESGCEEEIISSENDTEGDDNVFFPDSPDLAEDLLDTIRQINTRKKNVRFEGSNLNYVIETSETSSFDNEYSGFDLGYLETGRRRAPESHKTGKDRFRGTRQPKWQCGLDKIRPKSSPEKPVYLDALEKRTMGVGEHDTCCRRRNRCPRHHLTTDEYDDVGCRKPPLRSYKYECGDDFVPRCCDHCNHIKMAAMKHCHTNHAKEPEFDKSHRKLRLDPQAAYSDRYCPEEHAYQCKGKKKTLEAVQEQQEQLSDSTYKVPCNKFSSQTIPVESSGYQRKRSSEKLTNSSLSDWLYYSAKGLGGSLTDKLGPPRIHKLRSRRTRMNRIKNGWRKALVQTVRDESRNERVGVIVMGSKGPEFYTKNATKNPNVPFRKSKSFLDGPANSFEVMTVDCKNVFLSSSEPGPRTNYAINDLVCPEEDEKVEEKIARFSKNVNEIVKNSEEKFYKSLSCSEYPEKKAVTNEMMKGGGEGIQEKSEIEREKFHILQFESLTPRTPKSLHKPEKKINEESKAIADALNEQAKKYMENQSSLKIKEQTFLEELKEENSEEKKVEGSVKSTEQININKQRRKKYYESTAVGGEGQGGDGEPNPGAAEKAVEISAVFRDLVENGCAISRGESENLQSIFNQVSFKTELCNMSSSTSSEALNQKSRSNVSPGSERNAKKESEKAEMKKDRKEKEKEAEIEEIEEEEIEAEEEQEEEEVKRKVLKMRNGFEKEKKRKKEEKSKKKMLSERMKVLRQALPSIAAENEAAHLKQLKKYIDRFIDRVEASTASECPRHKGSRFKWKETASTDSSEVRVDAKKILDLVSNPFKRISSDVTINIAKKLTDALVQEKINKEHKTLAASAKTRKHSENETEDERTGRCDADADADASSGSERCEEPEPAYLKQLKKMRNEHLNNIVLEVKRLRELLRFLDRCNRLHF